MSDILIYSSNVKIITDENFESDVLGASVPVFVFFYASWSAYCKHFAVAFQRVADEEYGPDSEDAGKIILGMLNRDENPNTCDAYGILGSSPILKIYINGQAQNYPSGYEQYDFSSYCKNILLSWQSGSTGAASEEATKELTEQDAVEANSVSNVKIITDENFESDVLGASVPVFVFFYVPWNAYCKHFAVIFQRVADEEYGPDSENAGKIVLGILNGDENPKTRDVCGVSGYPALKIYMNGQAQEYPSGYEQNDFSSCCKNILLNWRSGGTGATSEDVTE